MNIKKRNFVVLLAVFTLIVQLSTPMAVAARPENNADDTADTQEEEEYRSTNNEPQVNIDTKDSDIQDGEDDADDVQVDTLDGETDDASQFDSDNSKDSEDAESSSEDAEDESGATEQENMDDWEDAQIHLIDSEDGLVLSGALQSADDVDWLAFQTQEATLLQIEWSCSSDLVQWEIFGAGMQIIQLDETGQFLSVEGPNYIKIFTAEEDVFLPAEYEISISRAVQDLATATAINSTGGSGRKLASGAYHNILLQANGEVISWGLNQNGRLGLGHTEEIDVLVRVYGLTDIVSVAAGSYHSLALDSHGTVWAWGDNTYGQLGDGTKTHKSSPVQVTAISDVVAIYAGYYQSFAMTSDGAVWGWGRGAGWLLGNGSTLDMSVPVQVEGIENIVDLATGENVSIALLEDGTIRTWGRTIATPVNASGLENIIGISAGKEHMMALSAEGDIWVGSMSLGGRLPTRVSSSSFTKIWTSYTTDLAVDTNGKFWVWHKPFGVSETISTPEIIDFGVDVYDIGIGISHIIIQDSDRTLWARGLNNFGQLGNSSVPATGTTSLVLVDDYGDTAAEAEPLALSPKMAKMAKDGVINFVGDEDWMELTSRYSGVYAIDIISDDTSISCEVYNEDLEPLNQEDSLVFQGNETYYVRICNSPSDPFSMSFYTLSIESKAEAGGSRLAASNHTLAVQPNGRIMAWGSNAFGQLGTGDTNDRNLPIEVQGVENVKRVAAGSAHSLALLEDGSVWAWGYNVYGQLGDGTTTDRSMPVPVVGLSDIIAIDTLGYSNIALAADGKVWAWGYNKYGQLGNKKKEHSPVPVQVSGLNNVAEVAAGGDHMMALKADGTLWTWGSNAYGQLGINSTTDQLSPVQVTGLRNIEYISAGTYTCGAVADGKNWAWGVNNLNQSGAGTGNKLVPTAISVVTLPKYIRMGGLHSFAIDIYGRPTAWGYNSYGQTGSVTTVTSRQPALMTFCLQITEIQAGSEFTVYQDADGNTWAFGRNDKGQLGNGTYANSTVPVLVSGLQPGEGGQAPDLALDMGREYITGLNPSVTYEYSIDSRIWNDIALGNTEFPVSSLFSADSSVDLQVREKALPQSAPGEAATVVLPQRPSAPPVVSTYQPLVNQFVFSGLSSAIEYRTTASSTWRTCTDSTITVDVSESALDYHFRYPSPDSGTPNSDSLILSVSRGAGPNVTLGYPPQNYISRTTDAMEYQVGGTGGWMNCTENMSILHLISSTNTVYLDVRYRQTDLAPYSLSTRITILPNNQVAPGRLKDAAVDASSPPVLTPTQLVWFVNYELSLQMGGDPQTVMDACKTQTYPQALPSKILKPGFTVSGSVLTEDGSTGSHQNVVIEIPLPEGRVIQKIVTTDNAGKFTYTYSNSLGSSIYQLEYPETNYPYYGDVSGVHTPWALTSYQSNATWFYYPTQVNLYIGNLLVYSEDVVAEVGLSSYARLGENWIRMTPPGEGSLRWVRW